MKQQTYFRASRLTWYIAGLTPLLLLPVFKYSLWWWDLSDFQLRALQTTGGAYATIAAAALFGEREASWSATRRTLVLVLAMLAVFLMIVLLLEFELPRYLIAGLVLATVAFIPAGASPINPLRVALPLLALFVSVAAGATAYHVGHRPRVSVSLTEQNLATAEQLLHIETHERLIPTPATRGGGIDHLGDSILLGTGDGTLYLVDVPNGGKTIRARALPTRVPANREEFAKAFDGSAQAPRHSAEYSEAGPPKVQTWRFRVADVIAKVQDSSVHLFASHHYWKAEGGCFVVRVSELDAPLKAFESKVASSQWRTVFESSPCIELTGPARKRGKNPFKGEEIGGRLSFVDDHTLLLTLGDLGFSGLESLQAFAQDTSADYGKTLRIDLRTGEHSHFTIGHRNPQGLYITPEGEVWETEHGTQGGDELNLLRADVNYGWPVVTYGTDYGAMLWPVARVQGTHEGFARPVHSWLPSIGISQVVRIEQTTQFPRWHGDLMIGSLASRSLNRVHLVEGRAVSSERIAIGKRVRDLLELKDGRLLVWTDDASLLTVAAAKHE